MLNTCYTAMIYVGLMFGVSEFGNVKLVKMVNLWCDWLFLHDGL